jgi:hypothetical protein
VRVSVLVDEAAVRVADEKLAVRPDGTPPAERVTGELNPPLTVNCTATVAWAPATSETDAGEVPK